MYSYLDILLLWNLEADTHMLGVLSQTQPLLRFRLNDHYMKNLDLGWYLWKSGQSESVVSIKILFLVKVMPEINSSEELIRSNWELPVSLNILMILGTSCWQHSELCCTFNIWWISAGQRIWHWAQHVAKEVTYKPEAQHHFYLFICPG